LSGELNYEKWAESFDESLEYATLCGIKNENSLIGIWELLPNGYENRKTEIENAFIQISGDRYTELCNTFKLSSSSNTPEDTTWTTITKTLERTSLQDNNKYDPSKKNSDKATIDRHASWELGTLNLYGFEEKNDKFIIKNASQLSIKYNLLQNIDSLPLCSGIQFYYVNSDTTGGIAETNVSDSEAVGKGAYWIRITYTDDTQTTVNKNNCLDGKAKGEFIELLSADDINQNKVVKKIELVFVYELVCGENLFLDWWTYPANFRCEFVMNF